MLLESRVGELEDDASKWQDKVSDLEVQCYNPSELQTPIPDIGNGLGSSLESSPVAQKQDVKELQDNEIILKNKLVSMETHILNLLTDDKDGENKGSEKETK